MTRNEIIDVILAAGFQERTKGLTEHDGAPAQGFRHSRVEKAGSIYVATDFIGATGPYADLSNAVAPSGRKLKGKNPYWEGERVAEVLKEIVRRYGAL